MSIFSVNLKTHSREKLEFPDANDCIIHGCKPKFSKTVAGRRKETFYTAHCQSEDCGKITTEEDQILKIWNKWNPVSYKSLGTYELKGRGTIYFVENDRDRYFPCPELLGTKVLIDGKEHIVSGVEAHPLLMTRKGQNIGLLVKS